MASRDVSDVTRVARSIATRIGEPMPQASVILRAKRYAGLDDIVIADWGRDGLARFIATLFPRRGSGMLRRQAGTAELLPDESRMDALIAPPLYPTTSSEKTSASSCTPAPFKMTQQREDVKYLVSIDSGDRDKDSYPLPNNFRVDMGNGSGSIRAFRDVRTVEIVSVIVPKHTVDGDNVDDYPYILLTIPELGGIYEASNAPAENAFAKLRFANDLGAYREYRTTDSGERFVKRFDPIRSLDRLTLQFFRPCGLPYNFGTKVMRRPRYCNVVTVQKKGKREPKRRPMYFDGEQWLPIESTPARLTAAKPETNTPTTTAGPEKGTGRNNGSNKIKTAYKSPLAPTHLNDLPASEVSVVLRITCTEMRYTTTNIHCD